MTDTKINEDPTSVNGFIKGEKEKRGIDGPKYEAFLSARAKEEELLKDIDTALRDIPNREEAEAYILENIAPKMDEAKEKATNAMHEWFSSLYHGNSERE